MTSYKLIPTTVYFRNIVVLSTKDVVAGFKEFLKRGNNSSLTIEITLKRRELISTYKEKIMLAFKAHITEITKLLKEYGYAQFSSQTDLLLFIRSVVDSLQPNDYGLYEAEIENSDRVLRVV